MRRKLYDILRSTSVFKRLWISSVTVAIIPTVLISALLLLVFWNNLNARMSEYSGNLSFQMASYADLQIQQLNNDIANFSIMDNTASFLRDYPYMSRRERYAAQKQVQTDINSQFGKLYAISDILLVTNDLRNTIHIYGGTDQALAMSSDKIYTIIDRLIQSHANTIYADLSAENGGMVIVKRIVDHNSGTIQGYILVHMRERFLSSIYRNLDSRSTSSDVCIIDSNGTVISSSKLHFVGRAFPEEAIARMEGTDGVLSSVSGIDGLEHYLCAYSHMATMPATVLYLVPRNYLSNDMLSVTLVVLLVGLILILLAFGVSTLIVNSITIPISELILRMRQVQDNQLVVDGPDLHADELAIMNNTFNKTVQRLRQSIEEIQRAEQEKVELELRALTSQISPHFLTNTLNTIRTLAQMQNVTNVESMVGSLINILSARLRKHDALVPLWEETALLQDYINLQSYRSFNETAVEISVEETVRDCLIPVFTLQPLVENSLHHGGLDSRIDGQIVIKAYRFGSDVHILVIDNGSGITPERLDEICRLQQSSTSAPAEHIGVQNIHQRIRLLFGKNYGLTFSSEPGLFTEVDIHLPFVQQAPVDPLQERSGND